MVPSSDKRFSRPGNAGKATRSGRLPERGGPSRFSSVDLLTGDRDRALAALSRRAAVETAVAAGLILFIVTVAALVAVPRQPEPSGGIVILSNEDQSQ